MAGGERRHLVEEEQLAVALAPYVAMAVVEFEIAADPLLGCPTPCAELLGVIMQPAAAIAHEQSARGISEQIAKRIGAVGKRHVTTQCHAPRRRGIQYPPGASK